MTSKFLGIPLKMAGRRPAIFQKYILNISHFSVIDQNHIRKRGKKQEKTLEKHFLQFTVRKNNFFKLLRKKKFFKLLWKKIGFESFCRT